MGRKALRKDFYMEIRRSMGRFLSIFFIVAIGVAFFSGIRSAEPDMRLSGDRYFDQRNLMDIKVISTLGLTEDDLEAVGQVEGIERAEPGYSVDAMCRVDDSKEVVHISSLLPTMNQVDVEEGRMPKAKNECLVDVDFLDSNGYEVGDQITFISGTEDDIFDTLKVDTYTITGSASSPCYISFGRGSSTIGTGTVSGFVYVPEESFDMDVYTEIYASVTGVSGLTAFTDEYDNKVEKAIDAVEKIQEEREEARYQEVVGEAKEKLNDAKEELAKAKKEAGDELDDAKAQLDDGRAQLDNGRSEVADGLAQMEDSRSLLNQKQTEIDQAYEGLNHQISVLNAKIDELNQTKEQYNALVSSQMADETTLQAMYAGIQEGEAQIEAAQAQVEAARNQLAEGQLQINDGWTQIEQGEAELTAAQNEIAVKEQELNDAQAKYDEAKAEADTKIADGEKNIQDAEDDISKIEHAKWYVEDRSTLPEYTGYGENADRMKAIGEVFPVLFFLVAALISLTTMTRMVEEQRTLIGTFKALGYERHSIAGKYLGYAFLATVSGSVFGVLIGEKILPYIIITAYGIMYQHMDTVLVPYNIYYALAASLAALACTMAATIFSCFKELREQAAELMRPPAPKQGKRVIIEKFPFIWRKLSFIWKATVRNLIRYKKRFFMTVFGIGGCMALLMVGFGLKDSIFDIGFLQYEEIQLYDGNVILDEDATDEQKQETYDRLADDSRVLGTAKNMLQQIDIKNGKNKREVYLNIPETVKDFEDFIVFQDRITKEQYTLGNSGAILTEKAAKMLDVKVGDSITVQDDIKGDIQVKIVDICENYMGHYLYMSPQFYKELFGREPEYNAVYYQMKEGQEDGLQQVGEEVLTTKGALSISYTDDVEEQLNDMLGSLNIVIVVLVISAGMLAFVVLYNLNNINITERQRELATLKVLGFYDSEVSSYVYRENIILTFVGAAVGMVLGRILHQFIIVTVEIDSAMFGRNIDLSSYVYSFLITVAFSLFVNGVMYFKLKRINMIESLKSVE